MEAFKHNPNTLAHRNIIKVSASIRLTDPSAKPPVKSNLDRCSYPITLITRDSPEDKTGSFNIFGTGLVVQPPVGYYIQIVANKELYRTGYALLNPIIIETGDKEQELKIPLYKTSNSADLDLPFNAVIMIICPIFNCKVNIDTGDRTVVSRHKSLASNTLPNLKNRKPVNMPDFDYDQEEEEDLVYIPVGKKTNKKKKSKTTSLQF